MSVRVVNAAQSASRDAAAIAAGTPSRSLMEKAGAAAAGVISRRFGPHFGDGVAIFAGPGNNGGDAWVVARHLAASGIAVRVVEAGESRTGDAGAARQAALSHVSLGAPTGRERVVVDGLLGTGSRGAPRGPVAGAVDRVRRLRADGAAVVALDLPTGVDASTGAAAGHVDADLTVTFGAVKRGHLVARGHCGAVVVVDIGLGDSAELDDGAPRLIDEAWVAVRIPPISAEAHKGVRRRIAIAGGSTGMAGACILAARAAMRSGVGMVRLVVEKASLAGVQSAAVEATAATWPIGDADLASQVADYAHAVLAGPGLGHAAAQRAFLEQLLTAWRGPTVLDADALNLFAGELPALARLLDGRPSIITPHPGELGRLIGLSTDEVLAQRFEVGKEVARALRAVVLLKGVPTVLFAPDGETLVSAAGTPVLATAGSGDVLGGIVTTLLAQSGEPFISAACAAWAHGRAAELANAGRPVRGVVLDEVIAALADVWRFDGARPEPPVMAELPRVGDPP
jgi:ADP-dependent NAD(P)H-hydrate dehydratase / NAD(P)H-hydrate epimerase